MKANELMIGDFVAIDEPDNYHGYTGKVCIINDVTGYITVWIQNHGYHEVLCDDLRPIPLTPEIFEKNGFEKIDKCVPHYFNTCFYRIERGNDVCLEVITDKVFLSAIYESNSGDFSSLTINRLSYIHQLQHALRLCGIDKEVVI